MILETARLKLREFAISDSEFIVQLLNTPGWLEFIGDRGVKTLEDAEKYLLKGPLESYRQHGFGLWMVLLKPEEIPIGMCGLLKRDTLTHPDLGFAFLPEFTGRGYAKESVFAALDAATKQYGIKILNAITVPHNVISQNLLSVAGFEFEKVIQGNKPGETLNLYVKVI